MFRKNYKNTKYHSRLVYSGWLLFIVDAVVTYFVIMTGFAKEGNPIVQFLLTACGIDYGLLIITIFKCYAWVYIIAHAPLVALWVGSIYLAILAASYIALIV